MLSEHYSIVVKVSTPNVPFAAEARFIAFDRAAEFVGLGLLVSLLTAGPLGTDKAGLRGEHDDGHQQQPRREPSRLR